MGNAAFITGGSSGIGLSLAYRLAAQGHDLALIARDAQRLQAALQDLKAQFPDCMITAHPADVGDVAEITHAVEQALAHHGPPRWAIANAGIAEPGVFRDQDISVFETHMRVNYMGALYFAKAVVPAMDQGHLVFVSSGAALFGIYGYSAYGPSKFAMRGLAETLRVELAPEITVTLAYPPDTDTPMLAAEEAAKPHATKEIAASGGLWQPEAVADKIIQRAQSGRFTVTPGFQMTALNLLHSLISPILRVWQIRVARKHQR